MDEICKQHDICYAEASKGYFPAEAGCDEVLVLRLKDLDNDPENWPTPPKAGTEGEAARYRVRAITIFEK